MLQSSVFATAKQLRDDGFRILPVRADGTKAPAAKWEDFQTREMTDDELDNYFGDGRCGIGICGHKDGQLNVIDFDNRAAWELFQDAMQLECPGLLETLPGVTSPRPGRHVYALSPTEMPNTKLASWDGKCVVEVRGRGGYVIGPGSPRECHETGKPYVHDDYTPALSDIRPISADHFETLVRVAREIGEGEVPAAGDGEGNGSYEPPPNYGGRPGDEFNQKAGYEGFLQYLVGRGWTPIARRGEVTFLRRPGKPEGGWSGKLCRSRFGVPILVNFSTNADPLEFHRAGVKGSGSYHLFAAMAAYEHGGDHAAAARKLASQGFGTPGTSETELPEATPLAVWERYEEIEERPITWLWDDRIPQGELTLVSGPGGCGKSTLVSRLMASVSAGFPMPHATHTERGTVLHITHEEHPAKITRPRLRICGADLGKIRRLKHVDIGGKRQFLSLKNHFRAIEDAILVYEPVLMVIDPISSYIDCDGNSESDVRGILTPFVELAQRYDFAIVGIGHVSKGRAERQGSDRFLGSSAYVNLSRANLHVERDPDDAGRRLVLMGKSNYPTTERGLSFRILEGGLPEFDAEPVDMTIEDYNSAVRTSNGGKPTKKDLAVSWLADRLQKHPDGLGAGVLLDDAQAAGLSRTVVYKASSILGVSKAGGLWKLGGLG